MKVVHLLGNWKWTGPAEPAVNLAAALARRGHEVLFVPGRPVGNLPNHVADEAVARGLPVLAGLTLSKHYRPIANLADRRRLGGWLRDLKPDIVHCHTLNDHLVAAGAVRRLGRLVPVIRSLYDGTTPRAGLRNRMTLTRGTSFLISASEAVRRRVVERYRIPEERTARVEGAVDLGRFDPKRDLPDMRETYGVKDGEFLLGIVARMQRKRRFEVLFDALDRVADAVRNLRVLLVGRGTNMEEVAVRRAERSRLAGRIVFTGYRSGDEFVSTLGLLSAKVFLRPGSDGSCRAIREAMAMGVPIVAARAGMIPEIVTDGENGLLVPYRGAGLADAIHRLAAEPELRERLAANAQAAARDRFDLERQAEAVETIYRRVLTGGVGRG